MSFNFRNCFKFQPFVVGLVGLSHKLQNTSHPDQQPPEVLEEIVLDEKVLEEDEYHKETRKEDVQRIILSSMINARVAALAVAINVNGKQFLKESYGYQDLENEIKATADMRCNIASVSKVYTAYIILKWLQESKFPVTEHQPIQELFLHEEDTKHIITLRWLLLHQCDLRHYSNLENFNTVNFKSFQHVWENPCTADGLYKFHGYRSSNLVFKRPFNNQYKYSSIGYDLAGMCLELTQEAKGRTYYQICTDELSQLTMKNTFLHRREEVIFDYCKGYEGTYNNEQLPCPVENWLTIRRRMECVPYEDVFEGVNYKEKSCISTNNYVDYSMKYASEGLVATVADLIKFGDLFLYMEQDLAHGKLLKTESANTFVWKYFQYTKYLRGLGWHFDIRVYKKESDGGESFLTSLYHTGGALGFRTIVYVTSLKKQNTYRTLDRAISFEQIAEDHNRLPGVAIRDRSKNTNMNTATCRGCDNGHEDWKAYLAEYDDDEISNNYENYYIDDVDGGDEESWKKYLDQLDDACISDNYENFDYDSEYKDFDVDGCDGQEETNSFQNNCKDDGGDDENDDDNNVDDNENDGYYDDDNDHEDCSDDDNNYDDDEYDLEDNSTAQPQPKGILIALIVNLVQGPWGYGLAKDITDLLIGDHEL